MCQPVANCLTQRMHKGINSTLDEGQTPIVTTGGGFNVAQPLAFKVRGGCEGGGKGYLGSDDAAFTVATTQDQWLAQPVAFHNRQDPDVSGDITHPIGAKDNGMGVAVNIYGGNKRTDRPEGGFYVRMDEGTSKTLDAASGLNPTCSQGGTAVMQPVAVAFGGDIARSLTARHDSSPCADRSMDVVAVQDVRAVEKAQNGKGWNADGSAYTVDTHATQGVAQAMQVRRLTPVECERLQGFPDGYTNIPWRGKPESPDGPRYKALGNSMAVPCMVWIGERINQVEAL